ncbi:FAD-dependent oxidoreductase [uncultured Maricaulis sp.]|uniref:NAD(P)/FAD-dependent oxidoreductase n=1 Tax=uncultured Maricaulis sp. TaxID=174710 RepID=UPI0030DC1D66|tara:strand:- start:43110 stop:44459 length:1350 start_codon:yes stop_codon:yes gene_type:complete
MKRKMRVAVIGSGIAGLSAAWRLALTHNVTLFEAAPRPGGHAHTVTVDVDGITTHVDTGFIVFNPANYPNFTAMLDLLGVETAPSDMSFAASLDGHGFEYSSRPGGLFAQKRNLLRPRMWRMLGDLLRLHARSKTLDAGTEHRSLDHFLRDEGYSRTFRDDHILPMCAAIWSSPVAAMRGYPASAFFEFFRNHGLMQVLNQPAWRTIAGGSRHHIDAMIDLFIGDLRLSTPVQSVTRTAEAVTLQLENGLAPVFDEVIFACHSDQAMSLLADPSPQEASLLGAIQYRDNIAVLHTDTRLMPRRKSAWASWNYLDTPDSAGEERISLTYWMNRLQPLPTAKPVLVTLNPEIEPAPELVLHTDHYAHPVFDAAAIAAQRQIHRIQGANRSWFCGAWLGSGFHEDGLQSGLAVAEALGAPIRPWGLEGMTERIVWPDHRGSRADAPRMIAAE